MNRLYCVHPKEDYETVDIVSAKSHNEARYISSVASEACGDVRYIDIRAELVKPGDYYYFMNVRIDIIGEGPIETILPSGVLDWVEQFIPMLHDNERGSFIDESQDDLGVLGKIADDIVKRLNTNVPPQRTCRVCGCTQGHACPGGCFWVEEDLCSQCASECEEEDV